MDVRQSFSTSNQRQSCCSYEHQRSGSRAGSRGGRLQPGSSTNKLWGLTAHFPLDPHTASSSRTWALMAVGSSFKRIQIVQTWEQT